MTKKEFWEMTGLVVDDDTLPDFSAGEYDEEFDQFCEEL